MKLNREHRDEPETGSESQKKKKRNRKRLYYIQCILFNSESMKILFFSILHCIIIEIYFIHNLRNIKDKLTNQ